MHFPIVSKKAPTVSKKAPSVSKKAPIVRQKTKIINCKWKKKLHCKLEASNCKQESCILSWLFMVASGLIICWAGADVTRIVLQTNPQSAHSCHTSMSIGSPKLHCLILELLPASLVSILQCAGPECNAGERIRLHSGQALARRRCRDMHGFLKEGNGSPSPMFQPH